MDFLNKRPLACLSAAFYISACIFCSLSERGITAAILCSFLTFAAILFIRSRRSFAYDRAVMLIFAGVLAAALFCGTVTGVWFAGMRNLAGTTAELKGTVTEVRYSSEYSGCYTFKIDRALDTAGGIKVILYADSGEFRIGDRLSLTARLDSIEHDEDLRNYAYSDGIVLSAEAIEAPTVIGRDGSIFLYFPKLRETLSARLRSAMSADSGGFAAALILGDRSHMPAAVSRDFRTLGISHIIALSGTHLTALFAAAGTLIPKGRHRGLIRFAVLCPAVVFYMALTGFSASIVRSGIMFIIAALAEAVRRESDSFTSLSAAVMLICLISPCSPWDIGLQLSFGAVVGLVVTEQIMRSGTRKWRKLVTAVTVPAVMLPMMWLRFGEITLVTVPANLVLVPIVSVLIPVLGVLIIISGITALFIPAAGLVDVIISLILRLTSAAAAHFDPMLPLRGMVCGVTLVFFTVSLLIAILAGGKTRRVSACLTTVLLSATLLSAQLTVADSHRGVTVCHGSSGTDDSLCIISDGTTVLVDAGRYPASVRLAAELGFDCGSGRIDAFMLSHYHQSHSMTLSVIFGDYYVKSLWLPVPDDPESENIAAHLRSQAESMGIPVYTYIPGESLSVGNCTLTAPESVRVKTSDHPALSVTVESEGKTIVYTTAGTDRRGDVTLIGAHGPLHKSIVAGDGLILTKAAAASLPAVSPDDAVSDQTVIRLKDGEMSVTEVK